MFLLSPEKFILRGLPMLHKLVEDRYYLPVLKLLSCVTPDLFEHRKMVVNEQRSVLHVK